MQRTFSDVLHYFKSQRCSGIYDHADNQARLLNSETLVDVRGGWYDASGDVSKYLSHLSYANYLNPQQIPMIVWNMLKAYEVAEDQPDVADFTRVRLLEEALFGADFLMRMQSDDGFFYMTVFDNGATRQHNVISALMQPKMASKQMTTKPVFAKVGALQLQH